MEIKFNKIIAKWIIPLIALIISFLVHILLFQINWNNEEEYISPSISVKIKKYKNKSKQEIVHKSKNNLQKSKPTDKTNVDKNKANQLIQDAMALAKSRIEFEFESDKKEQWRKNITETKINEGIHGYKEYFDKDGTMHIKIADLCFYIRESKLDWQFDEPIPEIEECRSRFN